MKRAKKRGPTPAKKPGPDPVIGLGLFLAGLLVMAIGGAATWHYVFNVGEGVLLLGAVLFLVSVAISSLRLDPIDWRTVIRDLMGIDKPEAESKE